MDAKPPPRVVGFATKGGMIVAVAFVIVVGFFRAFENRFIYFPPRYPDGFQSPKAFGLNLEEIWITSRDGVRLNAWFLAAPQSSKVLLWFHGNAANIGMGLGQMKMFRTLGVNILALDYRGYGRSEGSPDEPGVYADADAAYQYLVGGRHVQPRNILVYGHSLGGAVATDLAARHECGGLIVESSFASGGEMARRIFHLPGIGYVFKSRFASARKIPQVRAPVLVIHGTGDQVVPFWMGQKLYQAAAQPKSFYAVEGAGHDDIPWVGGEPYLAHLRAFILESYKNDDSQVKNVPRSIER